MDNQNNNNKFNLNIILTNLNIILTKRQKVATLNFKNVIKVAVKETRKYRGGTGDARLLRVMNAVLKKKNKEVNKKFESELAALPINEKLQIIEALFSKLTFNVFKYKDIKNNSNTNKHD